MLDCKTQYCSEIAEIAAHDLMVDAKDEAAAGFFSSAQTCMRICNTKGAAEVAKKREQAKPV